MDQTFNNNLLSRPQLKDKAKGALNGKFGQFVLAIFTVMAITLAVQIAVELLAIMIYILIIFVNELFVNGVTLEQLEILFESIETAHPYTTWITVADYIVAEVTSIFTNVFSVGIALLALNLACGKTSKVSDIFYGFRYQFGKSLKLSAILVLVNQLSALPSTITSYLADRDADMTLVLIMLAVTAVCLALYLPIYYSISQAYFLLLDFPGYSVGQLIKLSSHIMKGHKFRLFKLELSFLPLLLLSILSFGIGVLWLSPYMQVTYAFFFLNLMQSREASKSCTQDSIPSDLTY